LLQMARAHVDADGNAVALGGPCLDLAKRGCDHPLADFDSEVVVLDCGQQKAAFWMLPADESLGADEAAAGHVDYGLVVENEFAGLQCLANAPDLLVM